MKIISILSFPMACTRLHFLTSSSGSGSPSPLSPANITELSSRPSTSKGHTVAQLVEALCYELEGHWSESWWGGFFQFT
jgi:hypothetical protein